MKKTLEIMPNGKKIWRFSPDQPGTYPTFIAFHGLGAASTDINRALSEGLPKFLNNGGNIPFNVFASVDSNGWIVKAEIDPIIDYVKKQKDVNVNQIGLTGLSSGADACFRYLKDGGDDIAFFVMCSINSNQYVDDIPNMKGRPLRIFHGALDNVPNAVKSSEGFIHAYNKAFPGKISRTVFQRLGHNAWDTVYASKLYEPTVLIDNNPAFVGFDQSIYDWAEKIFLNEVEPEPTTGIFINGKWYGYDHCDFMGYLIEYRK